MPSRPSLTSYLGSGLCALCRRAGRGRLYPCNPQGAWTRGGFTQLPGLGQAGPGSVHCACPAPWLLCGANEEAAEQHEVRPPPATELHCGRLRQRSQGRGHLPCPLTGSVLVAPGYPACPKLWSQERPLLGKWGPPQRSPLVAARWTVLTPPGAFQGLSQITSTQDHSGRRGLTRKWKSVCVFPRPQGPQ